MYSVIIPVYCNEESLPRLMEALSDIHTKVRQRFGMELEAVFVVDGSPDSSYELLKHFLPTSPFPSKLVLHSRNFGSFAALVSGLKAGSGPYFGMMAADLQQPPKLLAEILGALVTREHDIVVGTRVLRKDPLLSRLFAKIFWSFYRYFVMPDIPRGGVDLFGCSEIVRNELIGLEEANSSLIGLVFWLGFRRKEIPYVRQERNYGKSAWTFHKRLRYLVDSIFAFTDLPIRLLTVVGALGIVISISFGLVVLILRLVGDIQLPGYAPIILMIMFFGGLNTMGIGIIGSYVWRGYENTKRRPLAVIRDLQSFGGSGSDLL